MKDEFLIKEIELMEKEKAEILIDFKVVKCQMSKDILMTQVVRTEGIIGYLKKRLNGVKKDES